MNIAKPLHTSEFRITDREFNLFRELIFSKAGISMADTKKGLVQGRLTKRLRYYNLSNFGEYYRYANEPRNETELQVIVDLLTTNETYFFREPKHFTFLQEHILSTQRNNSEFKVWSAACSTGEEPYSLAMVLAGEKGLTGNWNIVATDLNQQVLADAQRGLYPMAAAEKIPQHYLRAYCLEGTGQYADYFLLDKRIRDKIHFESLNLNGDWRISGQFDLIVLRNVMIYFNKETKKRLLERIATRMKPGGYLYISHSETLSGVTDRFKTVKPAIYRLK